WRPSSRASHGSGSTRSTRTDRPSTQPVLLRTRASAVQRGSRWPSSSNGSRISTTNGARATAIDGAGTRPTRYGGPRDASRVGSGDRGRRWIPGGPGGGGAAGGRYPVGGVQRLAIVGHRFGDESGAFVSVYDVLRVVGGGPQSEVEARMAARRGLSAVRAVR